MRKRAQVCFQLSELPSFLASWSATDIPRIVQALHFLCLEGHPECNSSSQVRIERLTL